MKFGAGLVAGAGAIVVLTTAPVVLTAQSDCKPEPIPATRSWSQPLQRLITVPATATSLRDALVRVATAAQVRLSYSSELLPVNRPVCIGYDSVAIGDALNQLLAGTTLEAVPAGPDYIVLAPARSKPALVQEQATLAPVIELQPVIAAASPVRESARTQVFGVDVLDVRQLSQHSRGSLAELINGAVPGLWAWAPSSISALANYGNVRGASSLGMSYPKIYIDGIEVANPLLVMRLSPDAIERIEVIRGPQGAALYGANATGGVTNIITRHESGSAGATRARLRSDFGLSASDFIAGSAFAQDHSLSLNTGNAARSAVANLAFGRAGEYMPDAFIRHLGGDGAFRLVGARTMVTGTVRFFSEHSGTSRSPLLTELLSRSSRTRDLDSGPA